MLPRWPLLLGLAATTACERDDGPAIPEPTSIAVHDAGSLIAAPVHPASGCPAAEGRARWGRGALHGSTVVGHEVWAREGSPHRFPNGVHLVAGATVTVMPCAVVLVGAGRDLVVQADARLRAEGTAAEPIVFGSASDHPAAGDWMGLEIRERALPGTRLAHVTVENAGAEPMQRGEPGAAIRSWIASGLEVDEVTVRATTGWGVAALGASGFSPRSRALRIIGIEGHGAVFFADADQVRTLPEGVYTGGESNDIFVAARRREVRSDGTWRNPGPSSRYRIRSAARLMVQGPNAPRLVIAPGTTLAFEDDAELDVGWERPGALVADGEDPRRRVVFTGAHERLEPATWVGVLFGEHADASRSRLRFSTIEGAGARAALPVVACPFEGGAPVEPSGMVFLQGLRADSLITQTEFRAGPPRGVAILVSGDSPLSAGDFTASSHGNKFAAAGVRCEQTAAPVAGRCPATPRCHGEFHGAPPAQEADAGRAGPGGDLGRASQH